MTTVRSALATLPFPASPEAAVATATATIEDAAGLGAAVLCILECDVSGYRALGRRCRGRARLPGAGPRRGGCGGGAGLLLAGLDLALATGLLARRCRT